MGEFSTALRLINWEAKPRLAVRSSMTVPIASVTKLSRGASIEWGRELVAVCPTRASVSSLSDHSGPRTTLSCARQADLPRELLTRLQMSVRASLPAPQVVPAIDVGK
jgi:hypothetical protein